MCLDDIYSGALHPLDLFLGTRPRLRQIQDLAQSFFTVPFPPPPPPPPLPQVRRRYKHERHGSRRALYLVPKNSNGP